MLASNGQHTRQLPTFLTLLFMISLNLEGSHVAALIFFLKPSDSDCVYFLRFGCILSMFVSKLVEDAEHHHGGQRLTRLGEQSIGTEHHRRERRARREEKRWAHFKGLLSAPINIHLLPAFVPQQVCVNDVGQRQTKKTEARLD